MRAVSVIPAGRCGAGIALLVTSALVAGAGEARAAWREDIGTFRIGIVAEIGAGATVSGLPILRDAYQGALGMPVTVFVAKDYAALAEAQAAGRVHYAVYSSAAYAAAWHLCGCVEPLASPMDEDGSTGLRSVLVVRDAIFEDMSEAGSHRIAMPPREDLVGYGLPVGRFPYEGKRLAGDEPFLAVAASAGETERMLAEGAVDGLFGWAPSNASGETSDGGTVARLVEAGIDRGRLSVLWQSDLLRYGPHAVRADLNPEAKDALRTFLVRLKETTPEIYDLLESHHAGGFSQTAHADYGLAVDLVKQAAETVGAK